ncbi:sodium/calcium exchanger Calx-like isoform X1 [Babylonia areolata]|uniref:sodium/calcium exchanger Calx-like isoform X1 n=1 Tax=Babylonia areolata TaxID=304850 RepID=UPI003FCF0211
MLIDPYNYTCGSGLMLPVFSEATWSTGTRAFLYLLGLLWCFLAVAIVADIFMCSIERITSKTRIVRMPDNSMPEGYRELEIKVWNDTVANLSLLALGTSAPEILLSVIEIVGNNFVAGELGPGTIVGSAAFNLLVISAICIISIPEGQTRKIASVKVFGVTAFSGIFAYVWLAIVLLASSPGYVELWEAIVTFLFFPLLILIAFLADKNFCIGRSKRQEVEFVGIGMNEVQTAENKPAEDGKVDEDRRPLQPTTEEDAEIIHLAKELGRVDDLPEEEAAKMAANKIQMEKDHDRGWYRINATRGLTGGRKLIPRVLGTFNDLYERIQTAPEERDEATVGITKHLDHSDGGRKPVLDFTAAGVAVMENEGKVRVGIRRHGRLDVEVKVRVETINGTALAGEDYKPFNEIVTFEKNETLKSVFIEIVDDFEWEPDEFFFVKLHVGPEVEASLGNIAICQITIINDDEPGVLAFTKPSYVVKETGYRALIPIARTGGADGHVSVKWRTKDITAIEGKDFKGGEGELKFDNQETTKSIDIILYESKKAERDESFALELYETDGGATLGKLTKCIVTIVNDEEYSGLVSRIVNLTKANLDALQLEKTTYVQQFYEAMNVNGGDLANATLLDYIMHFCTFFWKILFAFIPPAQYLGGWPAFLVSLAVIGFLTAIISDLASIFGCLINLKDAVTAITLVALGTSMPDTFASKQAAVGEKTADSSVGNINGSNSVNVFLGLGLPWLIATIYWKVRDGTDFKVDAGNVGFSVILFTIAAVIAIVLLIVRRFAVGAELGGPVIVKYISGIILVVLWILYVLLSSFQTYGIISVDI